MNNSAGFTADVIAQYDMCDKPLLMAVLSLPASTKNRCYIIPALSGISISDFLSKG